MIRIAALIGMMATPATAEQHLAELYAGILSCDDVACVGDAASLCMEIEEGGQTTRGMVDCLVQEAAVWDDLLNEAYAEVIAMVRDSDDVDRAATPELASRENTLRAAQRAWVEFRDANCLAEYTLWGGGTMRQIASASCQLQMTAARTLDLRSYLAMFP